MVIGHEFAGEVYEVGRNVTGWKVGDRVVSDNLEVGFKNLSHFSTAYKKKFGYSPSNVKA